MAPGDETDAAPNAPIRSQAHGTDLDALSQGEPGESRARELTPTHQNWEKSEVISWGEDFAALSPLAHCSPNCVAAAKKLKAEGLDIGVINARFVKPLDKEAILKAVESASGGRYRRGRYFGRWLWVGGKFWKRRMPRVWMGEISSEKGFQTGLSRVHAGIAVSCWRIVV